MYYFSAITPFISCCYWNFHVASWLVSVSSRHTLNLQVTALLMRSQYVETDGAEWKKVTFSTSYVALLMRSLKNPHNTPSVRSVGINNSAGDEFCQKPRVIFIFFFFIEPGSCWSSAQMMKLQLNQPMTKYLSGPLKWIRSMQFSSLWTRCLNQLLHLSANLGWSRVCVCVSLIHD